MKIQPSTRQAAFRKTFHELKLGDHRWIVETELHRTWVRTGMGWSDLRIVVCDLFMHGALNLLTVGNRTYLQLANAGLPEPDRSRADLLTRTLDWLALRFMGNNRGAMIHDTKYNRRSSARP